METEADDLKAIRETLRENKVKLWLPPFNSESGEINLGELENLARNYSSTLGISFEKCLDSLRLLQTKALNNLQERINCQKLGIAFLNVKIPNKQGVKKAVRVSMKLTERGEALREYISNDINVPKDRLKMIFGGKILSNEDTLISQGLNSGVQILVIIVESKSEMAVEENDLQLVDSTKADIKLLAEEDKEYLQVTDQSGRLVDLPVDERKKLILAMTLHEKGRAAMKSEDFSLALIMLLEAEKEFSNCNSALLRNVDNYGVLNLDIVWCYLNLESINNLPDAEHRLYQCELAFQHSYGLNFERLLRIKGTTGSQGVLFLRLHLLQCIVLYHQNRLVEAKDVLRKVEEELKVLKVDEDDLLRIMELGYTMEEGRLALRESNGDITSAVNIIEKKRQQKKDNEEILKKQREVNRRKKKLGKCLNGEWVSPEAHKTLMDMGYAYKVAKWALTQCSNNILDSLKFINENAECSSQDEKDKDNPLVEQVVDLGFEKEFAKVALKKHKGDINKAVDELVVNNGIIMDFSGDSDSGDSESEVSEERHEAAYSRVSEGISSSEEDYLNLNLMAETNFFHKYKNLLLK